MSLHGISSSASKTHQGRRKKVVVLGDMYNKVGDPFLPQAVMVQLPVFVGEFFSCLESLDTEKLIDEFQN